MTVFVIDPIKMHNDTTIITHLMAVGNLERKLAILHLEAIHSRLFLYRDTKHMYTSIANDECYRDRTKAAIMTVFFYRDTKTCTQVLRNGDAVRNLERK